MNNGGGKFRNSRTTNIIVVKLINPCSSFEVVLIPGISHRLFLFSHYFIDYKEIFGYQIGSRVMYQSCQCIER